MSWTPRAVRGAVFVAVGACAFKLVPIVAPALSESLFWTGFSQVSLTLVGLTGVCMGVYLLATRYKNG